MQHVAFSQSTKEIDSLQKVLSTLKSAGGESDTKTKLKNDTSIVNTYLSLAIEYQNYDLNLAFENASKAIQLSRKIDFKEGIIRGYLRLGLIQVSKSEYTEALESFSTSNKLSESIQFKKGKAGYYYGMYLICYYQSRYPEALEYLLQCIKLVEEDKDEKELAVCYSSIGSMFNMQKKYSDAIKNFQIAKEKFEKLGDNPGTIRTIVYMGNACLGMKSYNEAINYFNDALSKYDQQESNNKNDMAFAHASLGSAYYFLNNFDDAEKQIKIALEIYLQLGNKNGVANCYNALGRIYTGRKKYSEARIYLTKSIDISKEIGRLVLIKNNYHDLSVLDSAEGNFKQAFENFKLYNTFYDSIYNLENTENITKQKLQYVFDKKTVSDSLAFAHEKELVSVKLEKQRAMTIGGFGAAALTIVLLFFVYINYKKQKLANKQLKEAQHQLILSEKLAAFGVMASRVSHEIQNPLNFVNNFSEVSKDLVREVLTTSNEQDRKQCAELLISNLTKIHEHGSKAASIIRELQDHSNKGTAHDFFEPNSN